MFLFFAAFVRIYFFDRADIENVMGAKEQGLGTRFDWQRRARASLFALFLGDECVVFVAAALKFFLEQGG